jgi:iron complex outermembrane receptor protein
MQTAKTARAGFGEDTLKTSTVRGAVAAVVAGLALSAHALAESPRAIDIPSGDLVAALELLAKQMDIELIYQPDQLRGGRTAGVHGVHEPKEAVQLLLKGSRFSVRTDEETGVMLIVPAEMSKEPSAVRASDKPVTTDSGSGEASASTEFPSRLRVAHADVPAVPGGISEGSLREKRERKPSEQSFELEEIVITGTHIRGVRQLTTPAISMSREEIQNTGFATVQDLMESLPQNFGGVSPDGRLANEGGSTLAKLNNDRVSSIDLRGLGAQSTLTLVNGHRRAGSVAGRVVDVSAIPLSMIERVDVVTGGRSAVYGSDAVAGVVNFVMRRDFDGAETQAYYGGSADGGERLQVSQVAGASSERGGIIAGYDYNREWIFDVADAGLLSSQPTPESSIVYLNNNVQADSWRHAGFLSGRYRPAERVELYGDLLYTDQKFEDLSLTLNRGASAESSAFTRNDGAQYSVAAGARVDLQGSWSADLSGAYSRADVHQTMNGRNVYSFMTEHFLTNRRDKADVLEGTLVLDGPIPVFAEWRPHVAVGVEARREKFGEGDELFFDGVSAGPSFAAGERTVKSVFLEALLRAPTERSLEVSLAGRYDSYSDFGGTFNPQFGLVWEALPGAALTATYSTAFRAPALVETGDSTYAMLSYIPDPSGGPDIPLMILAGDNANLGPEKAKTWSLGLELAPPSAPWLSGSLSYFHIDYRNRVEWPAQPHEYELLIERQARYPGLLTLNPTSEQVQEYYEIGARNLGFFNFTGVSFDPATEPATSVFPNIILFDSRYQNIAVDTVRGIDGRIAAKADVAGGELTIGLNASYTLEHKRQVTPTSPSYDLVDEVGKPVALRARATAGWARGAYAGYLHLNYTDSYSNPFSTIHTRMDSYTTVDATLRVDGSKLADSAWLRGMTAALAIANLFDDKPPIFHGGTSGILYDSANASPFGRYYSLRLTRSW